VLQEINAKKGKDIPFHSSIRYHRAQIDIKRIKIISAQEENIQSIKV